MTTWSPKEATLNIRRIAKSPDLVISYKLHATERMSERGLIISDVLYVLRNGSCFREPLPTTRDAFNKYEMVFGSPNSSNRDVRVVVIPKKDAFFLKIVTVMWVDEKQTVAGNMIGKCDE